MTALIELFGEHDTANVIIRTPCELRFSVGYGMPVLDIATMPRADVEQLVATAARWLAATSPHTNKPQDQDQQQDSGNAIGVVLAAAPGLPAPVPTKPAEDRQHHNDNNQ